MRVKVTSTISWDDNGDEIIERYPFIKDPRFKLERVATGKRREFFDYKMKAGKAHGFNRGRCQDDGNWELEIYDGYRE